eukprot:scaffold154805_cov28-Tisochrysis_lutea.AAC.2
MGEEAVPLPIGYVPDMGGTRRGSEKGSLRGCRSLQIWSSGYRSQGQRRLENQDGSMSVRAPRLAGALAGRRCDSVDFASESFSYSSWSTRKSSPTIREELAPEYTAAIWRAGGTWTEPCRRDAVLTSGPRVLPVGNCFPGSSIVARLCELCPALTSMPQESAFWVARTVDARLVVPMAAIADEDPRRLVADASELTACARAGIVVFMAPTLLSHQPERAAVAAA